MTMDYKAEDLVDLIRKKYPQQTGFYDSRVLLEQVPDATSWSQVRWVDVVVFEMWKSKGLTRAAFEIKVSRSDFIRELSNPEKHKWCRECFHYFWFVAPKDIVQLEELPNGIGFMYPKGSKLAIARHALKNENPKLDDHLLAAFMRAADKAIAQAYKISSEEVLRNSSEHQKAKMYMEGTKVFLSTRGRKFFTPDVAADLTKALEDATMDKQLLQDREQLLAISGRFQRDMASLLRLFLIIASRSLIARNEMGEYIVSAYGGQDEEGLQALREHAKDKRNNEPERRYAETIELLLNWDRELQSKG